MNANFSILSAGYEVPPISLAGRIYYQPVAAIMKNHPEQMQGNIADGYS